MYSQLLVICLLQAWCECADPKIIFKTTNIECTSNPERIVNISCSLKAINWNKAVAQMDGDIVQPLRNFSIHFEIFKKAYNNQYHPFLVDVTFNACDIMAKRNFFSYGTIIYKIVKKYSNVNSTCPLNNHLRARDLVFEENLLPIFPLGFYMFSMTFTEGFPDRPSDPVGVIKLYLHVMEMIKIKEKNKKFNNTTTLVTTIGLTSKSK